MKGEVSLEGGLEMGEKSPPRTYLTGLNGLRRGEVETGAVLRREWTRVAEVRVDHVARHRGSQR